MHTESNPAHFRAASAHVFAALASCLALSATAGVFDDAKFKLDLRGDLNNNDFIDAGEAGNAVDFSAASPSVLTYGVGTGKFNLSAEEYASGGYDTWGKMPCIEMMSVTNAWYYMSSSTIPCLHFYQDSRTVDGVKKWALCGVRVLNAAVPPGNDGCATIYARFRWDGSTASPNLLVGNGWNTSYNSMNGQSIYLDGEGKVGVVVSNHMDSAVSACPKLATGYWHDVFVTTRNETINNQLTAVSDIYVCTNRPGTNAKPMIIHGVLTNAVGRAMLWGRSGNTSVTLGSYLNRSGWKEMTGTDKPRAFKGAIADVMIWDRALTDAERMEVLTGQRGAKWLIGIDNDAADEFNDGSNASIPVADPYLPETMAWNRMRKTLDEANRSLSIQSQLPFAETNKPVIFTIKPILSGTESPCRALVSVNGTSIETVDLATGTARNLVIPGKFWQRDANGNVTVTITRSGTEGTVSFDQVALSGSWQISEENRGSNNMTPEQKASSWAFAGDSDEMHITRAMSVGNSSTNYTFGVWVPKGMGEKCGWKFRTATTGTISDSTSLDEQHTVYVNGTAVGTHDGHFGTYENFTLDIPAGTLRDGMNYVQWVQTLPTRAAQQALDGKPGIFQYYDFWAMDLVPPANPFMLMVR